MKKLIMTIIMVIMNKALNGGTEFVFPTVKYSDTVSGHTGDATFFYYQK